MQRTENEPYQFRRESVGNYKWKKMAKLVANLPSSLKTEKEKNFKMEHQHQTESWHFSGTDLLS